MKWVQHGVNPRPHGPRRLSGTSPSSKSRLWRARAPGSDGKEPSSCVPAQEAARLKNTMLRIAFLLATKRRLEPSHCRPERSDLAELLKSSKRGVRRDERCSRRLHWHFQRALLLNEAGYACHYCGCTAWGVLAEDSGESSKRTLRFEVDHKTTRRRLPDRHQFDAHNLVMACRSCNTVKAEMTIERFLVELKSVAQAVLAYARSGDQKGSRVRSKRTVRLNR